MGQGQAGVRVQKGPGRAPEPGPITSLPARCPCPPLTPQAAAAATCSRGWTPPPPPPLAPATAQTQACPTPLAPAPPTPPTAWPARRRRWARWPRWQPLSWTTGGRLGQAGTPLLLWGTVGQQLTPPVHLTLIPSLYPSPTHPFHPQVVPHLLTGQHLPHQAAGRAAAAPPRRPLLAARLCHTRLRPRRPPRRLSRAAPLGGRPPAPPHQVSRGGACTGWRPAAARRRAQVA